MWWSSLIASFLDLPHSCDILPQLQDKIQNWSGNEASSLILHCYNNKSQDEGLGTWLTSSYCSSNIQSHVFLHLTAVNCGTLSNPAHGQVAHTAGTFFRQTATYSCNTGYSLGGSSTRTCLATRRWSGSAPTCQGNYFIKSRCKYY